MRMSLSRRHAEPVKGQDLMIAKRHVDPPRSLGVALALALAGCAGAERADLSAEPAGVYVLREVLERTNGVVLAGDGAEQRLIEVFVSLTDLYGSPGLAGGGSSSYAFCGAFLKAKGHDAGAELAQVTAAARRGDTF